MLIGVTPKKLFIGQVLSLVLSAVRGCFFTSAVIRAYLACLAIMSWVPSAYAVC